jgi:Domain of unknown function (DUF4261)
MAVMISMIMLRQPVDLHISEIERELQTRYPEVGAASPSNEGNTASLKLKDGDLVLGNMPAPIPWSDLKGPCSTSMLWKNASDEVSGHETHVIVTVLSERSRLDQAILLTKATAAVLATCDSALGVYWGNASLVIPKKIFLEFAQEILPHGPPVDIWVDFRVGWQTSKESGGFTQGLEALGHLELETQGSPEKPSDLRQRLHGLAIYLIENGPVIRDGHTVGQDAQEKISVVISDSAFGHDKRVMRLQYEGSREKPWWQVW